MLTTANPFDPKTILDGIRRWVEIETPTEAPAQVNKLATMVADGYRDLPATIERVAGQNGCGDHLVARSSWGQEAPGILDCPQYTRPAEFRGWKVPETLLGGNHEEIRRWRQQAAREKTARLRPDLLGDLK